MIWHKIRQNWIIYLLGILIPFVLWGCFIGWPLIYNIYLSFTDWNGFTTDFNFVGLDNYHEMLDDPFILKCLLNNVKWVIGSLLLADILGFFLAVTLHSKKLYFTSIFRVLFFLPYTMPLVTVGVMFSLLLSPGFGALDKILELIGLGGLIRPWLGDYNTALYTLITIFSWAYIGFPLMLFHTGINQIPGELYEAAALEGARPIQSLWYVTIPMMRSVSIGVVTLTVIEGIKMFDLVAVMTIGGPFGATNVLGHYMYTVSFRTGNQFGYGASIGVLILLLSSIFSLIYIRYYKGAVLHGSER